MQQINYVTKIETKTNKKYNIMMGRLAAIYKNNSPVDFMV